MDDLPLSLLLMDEQFPQSCKSPHRAPASGKYPSLTEFLSRILASLIKEFVDDCFASLSFLMLNAHSTAGP